MSVDFEAIVRLCRLSVRYELVDASLRIVIQNRAEVDRLVAAAASYRQADIFIDGTQQHRMLSAISNDAVVELHFDGLTSNLKVIAQSLEYLLGYQQGLFLYKAPPEYFLIDEGYATGDLQVPELVQAYQRVPKLFELIQSVADVVLGDGTSSPSFVLLSGKRMDFSPNYNVGVLKEFPDDESIERLSIELRSPPFTEAKKNLFKKVSVRLLEATPKQQHFAEFAKRFDAVCQAFTADFDLYCTEFNFEKVRESFEQKRLAFILQLNASTSDLLGKMLAIPIGQGLIVSQLKNDPTATVGNIALMLGSIVFAAFAVLLIFNQHHSLNQIKEEINVENNNLKIRFPQLYSRVEAMFKVLKRRAQLHAYAFPVIVIMLLITTTVYSGYAFLRVPPGVEWVGGADSPTKSMQPDDNIKNKVDASVGPNTVSDVVMPQKSDPKASEPQVSKPRVDSEKLPETQ
jgi:hypothetical protein